MKVKRALEHILKTINVGEMRMYAGSTVPSGWLACDGSAVSRTTYAKLFNAIGTTWGDGDGSTTFNLPDLRGRSAVGQMSFSSSASNNMLSTDWAIFPDEQYNSARIKLSTNMAVSSTYTLQLWDVYIYNEGKSATELNVRPFWGSNVGLTQVNASLDGDGITTLKAETGQNGKLYAHARHLTIPITTSTTAGDAQYLRIYNSYPDLTGSKEMKIGRWMLNIGSTALPWEPRTERQPQSPYSQIGSFGGIDKLVQDNTQVASHTHSFTDHWKTYKLNTTSRKPGTSTAVNYGTSITASDASGSYTTGTPNSSGYGMPVTSPYAVVNYIIYTGV